MTKRRAAVAVAKAQRKVNADEIVVLSTGVRARISPVTATLVDAVQAKIIDPDPPMVFIDEKGREEPNPSDSKYLKAMERAQVDRVVAAMDAMAMFGVELVDGLPADESWVKKLRLLERLGTLDLSDLDLDDPIEREFAYKRYFALAPQDIALVASATGLNEADIDVAEATFRSQEA